MAILKLIYSAGFRRLIGFVFILSILVMLVLSSCRPRPLVPTDLQPITTPSHTVPTEPTSTHTPQPTPIPVSTVTPSPVPPLAISKPENGIIELYGLLELSLQTTVQVANPYNPDEIDIKVRFMAPSGTAVEVGAFWFKDYDLLTRQPKGKPGWKVRFTPTETGSWSAVARISAKGLESEAINFQVVASEKPGFVRVHPDNPRYLAFDNGDTFFPIGLNMGWWGGSADAIIEYGRWLDQFSKNGGNTIRVWMASWSFGIEWKDTGLGNYNNRLYEAWLLDQLFRLAGEHHVKIILVLMNHGPFSLYTNSEWEDNPYNAERGGPLDSPEQFVKDPLAKAYYKWRLNYIANRWGYSTDLLAWEWFNEVNLTMIPDRTLLPWLREMTAYLRERDINHHLATNSNAMYAESPVWNLSEIDIIQKHEYALQENVLNKDLGDRAVSDFTDLAMSAPIKPILMGEFGYSAQNYGDEVEKTGIHLHNGLWATTFAGYAGTGMYWWWDIYVEKYGLWKQFNGLSTFLDGVDLAKYTPSSPLEINGSGSENNPVIGLGLRGADTLVWLRSNAYTVQASILALNGKPASAEYLPPLMSGLSFTLQDVADGNYAVSWFDPQSAKWLDTQLVIAQNGRLVIPIPSFRTDLAAKITPSR